MRRVLSLFLPFWTTDRLELLERKVGETEPVLIAARQGARRIVMGANQHAQKLGLRPGMAVAQAQAMQPGLRIEEADPAADEAGLRRLAAWCLRHISPLAALSPPDGIWIDITGCTHLFAKHLADGEAALLQLLTGKLAQAGIAARAAIAPTPGAAHALARYGNAAHIIVPPGAPHQSLAPLPVAALRLPEETVQALQRLGFETIGQLIAAPRAPLAKRFGTAVLRRLDQATGSAREPIEPLLLPEIPRTRMGFPEPIATAEDLARATRMLCERLCDKLLQGGLGARQADLVFGRIDGAAQTLRIGTAAPTRDPAHLARLLTGKIETIDPGFGIETMLLAASATEPLGARQVVSDLCAETATPDLAALVDSLTNLLGPGKIFRMAPVESDVPERALRRIPALDRRAGATWPPNLPRPARLLTPPAPITVLALLPDHAPKKFIWRRRPYRVRHADGPERIFGEWWKSDAESHAIRDYFGVEDEAGHRFWLFRHGDLRWFLHGFF
jgi:protein ImuB